MINAEDNVLTVLKENRGCYLSRDKIAEYAGINGDKIGYVLENLRSEGYAIEDNPSLGLRLLGSPDRMTGIEITHGLKTEVMGREIYSYGSLNSTNDVAVDMARNGAEEGVVITSETQLTGRGRIGRKWFSPEGAGIYMSVILRPSICFSELSGLTMLTAVSVRKAVRAVTGKDLLIKWPNDLYAGEKKVCGILLERVQYRDTEYAVVAGIGINVKRSGSSLPSEASDLETATGLSLNRVSLARTVLEKFEGDYRLFMREGLKPFMDDINHWSLTRDRRVKFEFNGISAEGTALFIDEDGGLVVRMDSGIQQKLYSSEYSEMIWPRELSL